MKKLIITALAILCIISSCYKCRDNSAGSTVPVFSIANLPTSLFSITTDRDTVLTGKSGTRLMIHKHSFVDSNGNPFQGQVTVELREALTPLDMVLGNMTTLTDGKILQSGGMLYLGACAGEEALSIDPSKAIDVSVPTNSKKDNMQIYSAEYDSSSGQFNWIAPQDLIVKSTPQEDSFVTEKPVKPTGEKLLADFPRTVKEEAPEPPAKPEQFDNQSDTTLSLIFDTASFPEFAQYRNVKFKVHDEKNFNLDDSKQVWNSMDLKKTSKYGIYIISFGGLKNGNPIRKSYKVSPVFTGKEYATALHEYDEKFAQYESAKQEIEKRRIELERNQRIAEANAKAEWIKQQEEWKKENAEAMKRQLALNKQMQQQAAFNVNFYGMDAAVNYVFSLKNLGWSNIDALYSNPATRTVELRTIVEQRHDFKEVFVTMLFAKEKIYLPGYQKQDKSYGFSHNDYEKTQLPVGETATIIATGYKDGKIYFCSEKIVIKQEQTVSLKLIPTTTEELRTLLEKAI